MVKLSIASNPPARVEVGDYYRRIGGKLYHVRGYVRINVKRIDVDLIRSAPTGAKLPPIVGRPWIELRAVLRWRTADGKKHSQFVSPRRYFLTADEGQEASDETI